MAGRIFVRRLLLGALLSLLAWARALGASYHVSPGGSDDNSGLLAKSPLRYIQTAINKSKAGDTIYLMPGPHTVKPGERNITFSGSSGKKGTSSAPITVTTTAPGVLIDLKDAEIGWGGFRISDGTSWIVIDGGGKPCPLHEQSYWLTIQNAAYQAATGNNRSGINCRPITIQQAKNITIRNIFGKRSMGVIGVFGSATRDILIENCRCVPGEKAMEPGVSHGIYVGSGADQVTIRKTFIKWGGLGRNGLQNNGGGVNVTLEQSYLTENHGLIKPFNGGRVVARNCWFWNNREGPIGNTLVEACQYVEPPLSECSCKAPAAPTGIGTSKPPAEIGPLPAPPVEKPPELTPEEKAAKELLSLGEMLLTRGEREAAVEVFQKLVEKHPGTKYAAKAQEHLERINR